MRTSLGSPTFESCLPLLNTVLHIHNEQVGVAVMKIRTANVSPHIRTKESRCFYPQVLQPNVWNKPSSPHSQPLSTQHSRQASLLAPYSVIICPKNQSFTHRQTDTQSYNAYT